MKKILTVVFALISTLPLWAQHDAAKSDASAPQSPKVNEEKVKVKKENVPVIEFEALEHDYGTVVKGANGVCKFTFKNKGKAPLRLTNVRSSCGCTVPTWTKEEIAPRKSGTITVKYDTNRIGPINKVVTVESNASNNRIQLRIKGTVVDKPVEQAPANSNSTLTNPNN